MRHPRPIARHVLRLGWIAALAASAAGQEPAKTPEPDPVARELLEAHNRERAKENLPPLRIDPKLTQAAAGHAADMAEHQKMSHDGSDGSTFSQRVVRSGYHFQNTGENVAQGYRTVEEAMRGWMESPPHKKNILGKFTEVGLARAEGKDGRPYWCADFGTPLVKLDPAEAARDLLRRINDERAKEKHPPMAADPRLARAAEAISAELAKSKGKNGTPTSFGDIDQRKYSEMALTTSVGQPDPDTLINTLLEKPDYKARILGKSSRIGIGYATDDDNVPYWTMILAIPSNR